MSAANTEFDVLVNKAEYIKKVEAARKKYEDAMDALELPSLGEDDGAGTDNGMGERIIPKGSNEPKQYESEQGVSSFEAPAVTAPPMRSTQVAAPQVAAPAADEWRTTSKGTRVRVVSQPQTSTEGFQVPKGFGEAVTQQIPQQAAPQSAPNFIQGVGTPNPDVQQFPATPNFIQGSQLGDPGFLSTDAQPPRPGELDTRLRKSALPADPMPIVRAFEDSNGRRPNSLREAAEWAHIKGYITTKELQAMLK